MHGLSVLKGNDPERSVLCLRHQTPQGVAAVRLPALLQGLSHYPQNPGFLDSWVLVADHVAEVGRCLQVGSSESEFNTESMP